MRGIGKGIVLMLAVAGFALVLSGSLSASAGPTATAATTANSTTYQDSTGEDAAAPDIASVKVSNDDAGNLTIAVTFANRTSVAPTEFYGVDLDTDRNAATGSEPFGADYTIQLLAGTSMLGRWDAGEADWVVAPTTLTTSWAGTTLTIKLGTKDLGNPTAFRFIVYGLALVGEEIAIDTAPDLGRDLWSYEVKVYVPPVLAITKIDCLPEPGVAGRTLVGYANIRVTRSGVAETLGPTAKVKWQATVGNVALKPIATSITRKATGGVARVTYKLPKTVKARSVRVKAAVTLERVTATKSHVHRIR